MRVRSELGRSMPRLAATVIVVAVLAIAGPANAQSSVRVLLPIPPVAQQTREWCWLSVGQMIFQYDRIPPLNGMSYQCGILQSLNLPCAPIPAGQVANIVRMFDVYPRVAARFFRNITLLNASWTAAPLPWTVIKSELDARRPIVAGISPGNAAAVPGLSQHAVLIVGYRIVPNDFLVYVNDPFPYGASIRTPRGPVTPPDSWLLIGAKMTRPGQYLADLSQMAGPMAWRDAIFVR